MNEQSVNNVFMQYVIENANLKIAIEDYKQKVAELEKQLEDDSSGVPKTNMA